MGLSTRWKSLDEYTSQNSIINKFGVGSTSQGICMSKYLTSLLDAELFLSSANENVGC